MLTAGTYKTTSETKLLIWDPVFADEYKANHDAYLAGQKPPFELRYPLPFSLKAAQEFTLEFGSRTPLVSHSDGKGGEVVTNVLEVTVKVGSKTHTGITLAYDDFFPSVVFDHTAVRPVKKRTK